MTTTIQTTSHNARDILQTPVTFVPNIMKPSQHQVRPLLEILEEMSGPTYAPLFAAVHSAQIFGDMDDYKKAKNRLPAFVTATTVKHDQPVMSRHADHPSGVMMLDYDDLCDPAKALEALRASPYFLFGMISPSGRGLKIAVYCDYLRHDALITPAAYSWYYKQVVLQTKEAFPGMQVDPSGCNLTRYCFISNHPLYINEGNVLAFHVEPYVKPVRPVSLDSRQWDDIEGMLAYVDAGSNRTDWLNVLFSMHHYNPGLLPLAIQWSAGGSNFAGAETIESYWESFGQDEQDDRELRTMASLAWTARSNGYQPALDWGTITGMVSNPTPPEAPGSIFVDDVEVIPATTFQDQVDNYVRAGHPADQLGACINTIALEADAALISTMIQTLQDVCPMNKAEIKDAIKQVKRVARQVEGGSQGTNADQAWLLSSMVTLATGEAYYNMQDNVAVRDVARLNSLYGHLSLGPDGNTGPGAWLAEQPNKDVCRGIGWLPVPDKKVVIDGVQYVNSYQPPHHAPVQNDAILYRWHQLCLHIFGEYAPLVLDHMAYSVQFPEDKIRWQVLTFGAPRSGKSLTIRPLSELYGASFKMVDEDMGNSGWGDVFHRAKFVVFEEVRNDDPGHFNKLKTRLANGGVETLNLKGRAVVTQMNVYSVYMFSNSKGALAFDKEDDKLLVIQSPDERLPAEFYDGLADGDMKDPAFLPAVYHHLLHRDVSTFPAGKLPHRTPAMYEVVEEAKGNSEVFLAEALADRSTPFEHTITTETTILDWFKTRHLKPICRRPLTGVLLAHGWGRFHAKVKRDGSTLNVRFIAPIKDCEAMSPSELYAHYMANAGPNDLR